MAAGVPVAAGVADAPRSTKTATETPSGTNLLDLCFVMDVTGSMGSYIAAAKQDIEAISDRLAASEGYDVRFGLVAYRDHPPQDQSFVTRQFAFSADVQVMKQNLSTLSANGGGDGPEAVEAGLKSALEAPWRDNAMKVVVLIADAPPHGLGERGDGFPDGAPTGVDPLQVLDAMSAKGICVYAVGCQPALSQYRFATDFFIACAERTNGQAIALGSAKALADVIMGASMEEMDLAKLANVIEGQVTILRSEMPGMEESECINRVTQELQARGIATRQMRTPQMFSPTSPCVSQAKTLGEAKKSLSETASETCPPPPCAFATRRCFGPPASMSCEPRAPMGRAMGARVPRAPMVREKTEYGNKTLDARRDHRIIDAAGPELFMEAERGEEAPAATFISATISPEQVSRMYARAKKKGTL